MKPWVATVLLAACSGPHLASLDATPVTDGTSSDGADGADGATATDFTFVIVGCNRAQKADLGASGPTTANLAQLDRTFAEIAALTPTPKLLFFTGDMVYGLQTAATLQPELEAWLAHYKASPLPATGIELVAVTGNHEVQNKSNGVETAYAAAETTWTTVMAAYIRGSNGPTAGGADQLQTDQSRLTYSFDYRGTHFVIIDTDPVGADGTVPATWIAADVAAAHAAGAAHIFAISHKPAYPSPLSADGGLAVPANRDALWTALESGHAEAMLSAHNHLWFKTRPNRTWQIVAGNGGSLLESGVTGADAYFGFTVVSVGARVSVTSYGRDVPAAGYLAPAPVAQYPTTIRDTADVTWP